MNRHHFSYFLLFVVLFATGFLLNACRDEGQILSKPDEYVRVVEAKEDTVIKAIVQVFKDKKFGDSRVDYQNHQIETDETIQDNWRSKCRARIKQRNWKACEITLSVITEKKTASGWEPRRLLEKQQYDNFFDAIELQIYNEAYEVK
jgi:hypothetical protein